MTELIIWSYNIAYVNPTGIDDTDDLYSMTNAQIDIFYTVDGTDDNLI